MTRKKNWARLALIWVAAAGILPATVPITQSAGPHEIGEYYVIGLTYELARSLGIPIGFEGVNDDGHSGAPSEMTVSNENLADAMNSIVSQRPGYSWSRDNGVVHVFFRAQKNKLSKVFIRRMSFSNVTLLKAHDLIEQSPEVQRWMASRGLQFLNIETHFQRRTDRRVSVDVTNVPLRTVFDAIAMQSDYRWWGVYETTLGTADRRIAISFF